MEYMSVNEAARIWEISPRRVRALCEAGRIQGAARCGDWVWSIPKATPRPADGRTLRRIRNLNLKAGAQDYRAADSVKAPAAVKLTDQQKIGIILDALTYSETEITEKQIEGILKLYDQELPLKTHLEVLNMASALSDLTPEITESYLCAVNRRLLLNIDEQYGGRYRMDGDQVQAAEALMAQYAGPWSVLHSAARGAFLFAELIRIQPFVKGNIQTAFVMLAAELVRSGFPPAVFGKEQIPEVKAALVSAGIRGNTSKLTSLIVDTITGNPDTDAAREV